MAKMDKKWVLLCSTAVAAVYSAGFFSTEAQATKVESQQHAQMSIQTRLNKSSVISSNKNQATKSNVAASNNTQTKQLYKDGTYTGMGENRRGSIEVAVTIKNDKITDVEISNFAMHYSERDVVGLPDEVLQKQSAQVTNVSGATYSTQAFEDAVQEALSQAQNA
ncbi:FMN-binding protein [Neobacillus ginsengisoli]|uniref:Uncharacterized protein with FMN-binding domain n=1 Tax=Neobacillus ginsengisoli TaxID=904295 RepID=A0ABT9Y2Y9_9BACI|nr:FMN-binding protein [Neobacillus ginsengisoli]MDQ0202191.1 uncharacterized protein with FMN-binding domain [Neobacillus ginsengisoli]